VNPDSVPATIAIVAYGIAAVFGVMFLIALSRTDWYRHPWGRNVASFMICLVPLELFAFFRRFFGDWPGQSWMVAGLSVAVAVIQAWRWWLQYAGNRDQRKSEQSSKEDPS
jgi:hypothetical protein